MQYFGIYAIFINMIYFLYYVNLIFILLKIIGKIRQKGEKERNLRKKEIKRKNEFFYFFGEKRLTIMR